MAETYQMLPIHAIHDELIQALRTGNRLVLTAPTGSGKTTQVPQFLMKSGALEQRGQRQILVLQPRRLAARMVAERVAVELGTATGELVGYQTRHESRISPQSVIRFMTEGLFLRLLQSNPKLEGVGAVILDEFHERNLATDASVALVKLLQETARPDLRAVVMSATLETRRISAYLGCQTMEAHGRAFPVDIHYLAKRPTAARSGLAHWHDARQVPVWDLAADALAGILDPQLEGDVLIFMPGAYEIRRTIEACGRLEEHGQKLWIFPLYSELSAKEQDAALAPCPGRKVIVSTNVAETSITIPGIRHVIDSGLARINRFDPRRGINVLLVEPISQASADQRAGRAGRTAPGTCWRLWPENEHRHRPAHSTPEIQRLDLAEVVLQLHSFGIGDLEAFPWLEAPNPAALQQARQTLRELEAIESERHEGTEARRHEGSAVGSASADASAPPIKNQKSKIKNPHTPLTPLGATMARLPMHPRLSRMLVEAAQRNCLERAALWAALISERDILMRSGRPAFADQIPKDFPSSDFLVLERAMELARGSNFDPGRCANLGLHANACRQVDRTRNLYLDAARRAGLPDHAGRGGEGERERQGDKETRRQGEGRGLSFNQKSKIKNQKSPHSLESLAQCLLVAFPDHLALRRNESNLACALTGNRRGQLDPDSIARHVGLLLPIEIREIGSGAGQSAKTVLSVVTEIHPDWLMEVHPDRIEHQRVTLLNPDTQAVETMDRQVFEGLTLEESPAPVDLNAAAEILAENVINGTLKLEKWDEAVEQWISRVRCVAQWFPERKMIQYDQDDRRLIIQEICAGASRHSQIKDRPCLPHVKDALSWEDQQFVEKMAPERYQLPRGWRMRIDYTPGAPPRARAKIQDLYGLTQAPTIAGGRVRLILEILAPNMRPVQMTEDLANFWTNLYPTLKKELARRYPKHEWR